MNPLRVGVLTVSDSSFRGEREDTGGPAIIAWAKGLGWSVERRALVPDGTREAGRVLRAWCDRDRLDAVLTTGGTGLGPRDRTPEATKAVLELEVPGVVEALRAEGRRHTPYADLSRALCGVRGKTFILNLPGSPRALTESFPLLETLIPHALKMMAGGCHPPKRTALARGGKAR